MRGLYCQGFGHLAKCGFTVIALSTSSASMENGVELG